MPEGDAPLVAYGVRTPHDIRIDMRTKYRTVPCGATRHRKSPQETARHRTSTAPQGQHRKSPYSTARAPRGHQKHPRRRLFRKIEEPETDICAWPCWRSCAAIPGTYMGRPIIFLLNRAHSGPWPSVPLARHTARCTTRLAEHQYRARCTVRSPLTHA